MVDNYYPSMPTKAAIAKFEKKFHDILKIMASGETVFHAMKVNKVSEDFLPWVMADEARKAEYEKAQETACEVLAYKMLALENVDPEEMYLAKTKMDIYKFLMSRWGHQRYGEKKQVEQKVTIDITKAIELADRRLEQRPVIDVEPIRELIDADK